MVTKLHKKFIQIRTRYGYQLCKLEPDKHGYIITAHGLPGVVTWGKNINHAKKMAKEAIKLCIECLAKETFSMPAQKYSKHILKISKMSISV